MDWQDGVLVYATLFSLFVARKWSDDAQDWKDALTFAFWITVATTCVLTFWARHS